MAPKSTSFFNNDVNNNTSWQKPVNVLEPIENAVAQFFVALKSGRTVPLEKVNDIRKILTDLVSDELIPYEDREQVSARSKQLFKQLDAVDYFSIYPSTEALATYLRLLAINQKPIGLMKTSKLNKTVSENHPAAKSHEEIRDFLKTTYEKIQTIHHELKPLEVQPSLTMVMPNFEELEDVHTYIYPFQKRAAQTIELNKIQATLEALKGELRLYSGVSDAGQRRLVDQYKQGVISLLNRVAMLRTEFSRQPVPAREAIASSPTKEPSIRRRARSSSKKPVNLTLS